MRTQCSSGDDSNLNHLNADLNVARKNGDLDNNLNYRTFIVNKESHL